MAGDFDPGDLDDDLPPLVGEDGEEIPSEEPAASSASAPGDQTAEAGGAASAIRAAAMATSAADGIEGGDDDSGIGAGRAGFSEAEVLRGAAALQAQAALQAAQDRAASGEGAAGATSAQDAMRNLLAETEEPKKPPEKVNDKTLRMVTGISKDDFEEVEDAIMQGADVNAECGGGMRALHFSSLRGEMFLTELLIAHGANVNERDMSGNTPLIYACHFYRQHGKGMQLAAQLLYHGADPHFRVREGKLAGKTAHDIMDKACNEPNTDENVPRQMRAMLQLAMEGTEACRDAITKVWMQYKSQNKKLYQVSSKKDNFGYSVKSVAWETPADAKNAQPYAPVKLEAVAESIVEERFTNLRDHLFNDEGDKVKVYVTFPESAQDALNSAKTSLEVVFDYQTLDLKLRGSKESWRLRIDPLFGSIEVPECKHRVSAGSRKVTLTLVKRHKNRTWSGLQKAR